MSWSEDSDYGISCCAFIQIFFIYPLQSTIQAVNLKVDPAAFILKLLW